MNLTDLISSLQEDMSREYAHWHFYMQASMTVQGLHRAEYSEFFAESAAGEMKHISEFGKLIIGLGGEVFPAVAPVPQATDPRELLNLALTLEEEVVSNYVERQDQAEELENNGGSDKVAGRFVQLFLDAQILDSRTDADNIREMLKGKKC